MTIYLLLRGKSGRGKSYTANRLVRSKPFREQAGVGSCPVGIVAHKATSGDYHVVDPPGSLDSRGSAVATSQAAELADYCRGKSFNAIVIVCDCRLDSEERALVESYKANGYGKNIVIVHNKNLSNAYSTTQRYVDEDTGCLAIYVNDHQESVPLLEEIISEMAEITVEHVPAPLTIFKSPLILTREENVEEFLANEIVESVEARPQNRTISVPVTKEKWVGGGGGFGRMIGQKKTWTEYENRTVTDYVNVVVPKNYRVMNQYQIKYGERIDGKEDIYSKTFVKAIKTEVSV
jgi:GTPase SAR1 family protein